MRLEFFPPNAKDDESFIRDWPAPPQVGTRVRFSDDPEGRNFFVKQVHWGDMVMGGRKPSIDRPCAAIDLTLYCSWCEGNRAPGEECACTETS